MIDKANAVGGLGITHDNRGANKPATSISWLEATKFINWLNISTGHTPAYKFDGSGNFQLWQSGDAGYDPNNLYRNRQAYYFLPSVDEWYKAAYYDPSGVYYDYPTGSDSEPDGIDFAGDATFDAMFQDGGANAQPNDITEVGVMSPYGTAGQGGNVWELQETDFDQLNDSTTSLRISRGGNWEGSLVELHVVTLTTDLPFHEHLDLGFRVASVPEPSTLVLGAMAGFRLMSRKRRRTGITGR